MRWQSKARLGRRTQGTNAEGNVIYGDTVFGPESFTLDGFVGYRRKIALGRHDPNMTVQLNVANLTNEGEFAVLRYNQHFTGYTRLILNPPRQYRVSLRLDF